MKIHKPKRQSTGTFIKREASEIVEQAFQNRLSFYVIPPTEEMSLEEFGTFAKDRLKEIESLKSRNASPQEYRTRMASVLSDYLPLPAVARKGGDYNKEEHDKIRKDVISHFTLRLVYCRPNDRTWFLTQERELLKLRLQMGNEKELLEEFVREQELSFPEVEQSELATLLPQLRQVQQSLSNEKPEEESHYYKVPFQDALELVQKRKVLVKNGYVYVGRNAVISLVLGDFRKYLAHCLAVTYKHFHEFQEDNRLMYLIEELPKMHLGREYVLSGNKDEVKIDDLDTLAKQSMPPCMQNMHTHLRTKHHLKHFGRLSYSLFLKGIGVSLEAALEFWREELETRGGRNFDKEFAYNFKHSYGSVGKRTSYTPYACHKIIDEPAVEGGVHGCPFKTQKNDKGQLKALLQVKEVGSADLQEILKFSNEGQYQIACKCLFDRQHPGHGFPIEAMNHPNRYFDLSLQYIKQQQQIKEWENQKMEVEQKSKAEST